MKKSDIEKFNAWFRKAVICKEDDCETCKPLRDKWKLFLDSLKGGLEKNG